jgi:hypothetical protein
MIFFHGSILQNLRYLFMSQTGLEMIYTEGSRSIQIFILINKPVGGHGLVLGLPSYNTIATHQHLRDGD